jgi:hypothetical protein
MRLQTVRTWVDSLVDKKRASRVLGWQQAVDACIIINGLYVTGIASDVDCNFLAALADYSDVLVLHVSYFPTQSFYT